MLRLLTCWSKPCYVIPHIAYHNIFLTCFKSGLLIFTAYSWLWNILFSLFCLFLPRNCFWSISIVSEYIHWWTIWIVRINGKKSLDGYIALYTYYLLLFCISHRIRSLRKKVLGNMRHCQNIKMLCLNMNRILFPLSTKVVDHMKSSLNLVNLSFFVKW